MKSAKDFERENERYDPACDWYVNTVTGEVRIDRTPKKKYPLTQGLRCFENK